MPLDCTWLAWPSCGRTGGQACRYVDEVVAPAPDVVTLTFLREHDLSTLVHGDDLTEDAIAAVYAEVAAAGMLRLVPRRTGLSTTELIRRVRDRGSQAW